MSTMVLDTTKKYCQIMHSCRHSLICYELAHQDSFLNVAQRKRLCLFRPQHPLQQHWKCCAYLQLAQNVLTPKWIFSAKIQCNKYWRVCSDQHSHMNRWSNRIHHTVKKTDQPVRVALLVMCTETLQFHKTTTWCLPNLGILNLIVQVNVWACGQNVSWFGVSLAV